MIEIPEQLTGSKEPFLVCSKSVLKEQVKALEGMGLDVFYSVKTNPEPSILRELRELGIGFSAPSPKEFLSLVSMGVSPQRIYYYERALTKERAKWLVESGCKEFVVDSKRAFDNLIEEVGLGSTVLVRMKAPPAGNSYSGVYVPGFDTGEAKKLLEECRARGIKNGVLHHSSSQMDDPKIWRAKFEELSKIDADIIDIGGGIPIDYDGQGQSRVLEEIKNGVKRLKAKKIIAEPGRFIVGPACSLVARAELVDGHDVVVNCSVYDVHIDTIIAGLVLPCRNLGKSKWKRTYRILGSSLCNLDVFNQRAELPDVSEGDVIVFDKAGAYNFSSDFSAGGRIKTYVID